MATFLPREGMSAFRSNAPVRQFLRSFFLFASTMFNFMALKYPAARPLCVAASRAGIPSATAPGAAVCPGACPVSPAHPKALFAPAEPCIRKIDEMSGAGGRGMLTGTFSSRGVRHGLPVMVRSCRSSQNRRCPSA